MCSCYQTIEGVDRGKGGGGEVSGATCPYYGMSRMGLINLGP